MANTYDDATGVLILDRVTPVIRALFSGFSLDESHPGNGNAYIARISESNDTEWDGVLERLIELAGQLGVSVPEGEDANDGVMETIIEGLARHFGTDQDPELQNLIEHHSFEDSADLAALALLAACFNDGHNLAAIEFEGCWHCSKPRLFEFGGYGQYISRELFIQTESSRALALGRELREAIVSDDVDRAARRAVKETQSLLAGVCAEDFRGRLRRRIAELLLEDAI